MGFKFTAVKVAPRGVFAFSLLAGAICGAGAVRFDLRVALIYFLLLAGCVAFFYGKRFGALMSATFLLGLGAAKLQLFCEKPLPQAYQNVVVRCADANQTQVEGLPPLTFVAGMLEKEGKSIPVCIRLPRGCRAFPYGTKLQGFAEIEPIPEPGDSFADYCAARHYRAIVKFHELHEAGCEPGVMGKLLQGRDFLLRQMTQKMTSDDARAISAALIFGVRSGIKGELRQKFVDAGVVHLFSVSGMHVAILAAILLFFLRVFPLRVRYIAVVALLGVYTLTTGANPPAVRAFWLISAWALCRAFLREIPTIEVLGIVGTAMLLVNPALLGDVGAQYSFFITAVLLAAGEYRRRNCVAAQELLMASKEKHRFLVRQKWRNIFLSTLFFCSIAFAAGIGITMISGNDLRFGGIVANLLFTLGAVPLFAVGVIAIILPGMDGVFENLLLGAMHWCEWCGKAFPATDYVTPEAWQVILYMLMLLIAFFCVNRWVRRGAVAIAAALLIFWLVRVEAMPDAVAFFQGDGKSCGAIVIVESRFHRAVCINLPDYRAKNEFENFLRAHGVTSIDKVYFTENRRRNCGCLAQLDRRFRPKRLIAVNPDISSNFITYLEEHARRNDLEMASDQDFCRIFPVDGGFALDYFFVRDNVNAKLVLRDDDLGRHVSGAIDGKSWFYVAKPWAKNPKAWSFDVPKL